MIDNYDRITSCGRKSIVSLVRRAFSCEKFNTLVVYNNNIRITFIIFIILTVVSGSGICVLCRGRDELFFSPSILDKTWWSDDASVRQETSRRVVERQTSSGKMDNRLPGRGRLYRFGADSHKNSRRQVKNRKRPDRKSSIGAHNIHIIL